MKQLTIEQELRIIQAIYNSDDYIGHGGGRMVFDLPREFYQELGLSFEYVVKVAIGEKGLSQNTLEINSYKEYHDQVALAEIPYCGQIIEIMEKVDTELCDYIYDLVDCEEYESGRDFCYALCQCYGDNMTGTEILNAADSLAELLHDLTEINGYTADNAQIGINVYGKCVAYDFGFDCELGCSEQCSDTREYIYDELHRHTLLNLIMEVANDDPVMFEADNIQFMAEVERQFFDYIHEDDEEEEDICGYDDEEEAEPLRGFTNHNEDALDFATWDRELTTMKWNDYIQPIEYQPLTHILPVKEYVATATFNDWQFKNFLTDRENDIILSYK